MSKLPTSKLKTDLKYRCYYFSIAVIQFLKESDNKFRAINDQLLRSSTSIGANIVEAKSSSSRKEFIKYYQIALKSANETKYWLALYRDAIDLDANKINDLLTEAEEISKMLASSIITLKDKKF
ncbi:four helix bundle protein [Candidatus Berkelbacteria bacterium CG_4_9_14_0_2_um_filter_42_30]|uniref:Four helix bundle protein n=3 Tax=Candidatus Berkelbacteria TaxID=1618330 RepID=A0A2M7K155_9BACT|nr:MAG: four helix bundle protein [Candidatus Berkelbacteria bacterium CG11_big_fil_rev_8_21_14_0_20_42_15]PIX29997.1 MAG: four helix bundle protein [Candidatus Berkelbacteria bacterium CG_4_8_14_3_um_filter_42_13]PJC65575.1 MAG: four helix bundle protein [Candidatus Berkelbacteria bacterium CG_4_9_14_0_2_um_filter_42_30]